MEKYEIDSNGQKFIFTVLKNTTEPCPVCGVPACGSEDILWYDDNKERIAIIFDGGSFDMVIDEFFKKNNNSVEYNSLPTFLKEWNEDIGWADCSDYYGYVLDIEDFLKSMDLLKSFEKGNWICTEEINNMKELVNHAQNIGAKLKIVRA